MKQSSLTVVGTGIKFLSQMTMEARVYIEKSDKVLYLVCHPALKEWIQNANRCSESLDNLYFSHSLRSDSYKAITHYIIDHLSVSTHICVVLYGHPTVFAKPALDAVIEAKKLGYDAKVLPGISAEDCLFADLLIDPGTTGCQSFEATDFLLYRRRFDTHSHLILWQPDVIGTQNHDKPENNTGIKLLIQYLLNFYRPEHEVIIYEAAQYPGMKPNITSIQLRDLEYAVLTPLCTLYIKPISNSPYDYAYARHLGCL